MCSTEVDVLDTREVDGVEHRVYLVQDQDCESPRESGDCQAGIMVTRSNRYSWPVEDCDVIRTRGSTRLLSGTRVAEMCGDHEFRVIARWLRTFYGANVVLPLYARYDDRPSAGDESDTPDAGSYIGVTFDQPSTRTVTGISPEAMAGALTTDVDEFSAWAVGECYGYVIERAEHADSDRLALDMSDHAGWEHVDSCWGFIGDEYARQEAIRALSDI